MYTGRRRDSASDTGGIGATIGNRALQKLITMIVAPNKMWTDPLTRPDPEVQSTDVTT